MIAPVLVSSGTGDLQAVAAAWNLRLKGFSIGESAAVAAAAEVVIRHGTVSADPLVAPCNLAADGFGTFWYGEDGVPCPNGIYIERVSGTTTLVLYVDYV